MLVLAVFPGFAALGEDEPSPAAPPETTDAGPPDEAQVARWVEELGAEEFWTRDAASRGLEPWVDCFWPVMASRLEDEDIERTCQLRDLAHQAGIVPADEAATVQNLLETVGSSESIATRDQAYAQLLRYGAAGRASLQRFVLGTGARLVTVFDPPPPKWVLLGTTVELRARLEVRGAPCWNRPGRAWMNFQYRHLRLGGLRDNRRPGGRLRRVMYGRGCESLKNPLLYWTLQKPGAVVEQGKYDSMAEHFGQYRYGYESGIRPETVRAPGDGAEELMLAVNADLANAAKQDDHAITVWALPDFAKPGSDGCLDLSVTAAQDTAESGGFLGASVKIAVPDGGESRFLLEASLPKYAWFVVLGQDGVPAAHGGWQEALSCDEQETDGAGEVHEVAPGRPVSWNLSVPMPSVPGTYRLGVCYQVGLGANDCGEPKFADAVAHTGFEPYTEGLLWAASEPFEVAAPTPPAGR